MKRKYTLLLILLVSTISALALTYYQVVNDKKEFIAKLDNIFEGDEIISAALSEGLAYDYKILNPKTDKEKISNLSFGRTPATAIIQIVFGYKILILEKRRLIDGTFDDSYGLDSITQHRPLYFGPINDQFKANYRNESNNAAAVSYNAVVQNYAKNLRAEKYSDIADFPYQKSTFYYLKRVANITVAKPGTVNSIGHDIDQYRIHATKNMINYVITPNHNEMMVRAGYNFIGALLLMILLSTIVFLLTKIFSR